MNSNCKFSMMETTDLTPDPDDSTKSNVTDDPNTVTFNKYGGGKAIGGKGKFIELTSDFVVVTVASEDESSTFKVKFKRNPGPKAGWGIGVSKFWRLDEPDRKKYCHRDIPSRLR